MTTVTMDLDGVLGGMTKGCIFVTVSYQVAIVGKLFFFLV